MVRFVQCCGCANQYKIFGDAINNTAGIPIPDLQADWAFSSFTNKKFCNGSRSWYGIDNIHKHNQQRGVGRERPMVHGSAKADHGRNRHNLAAE